MSRLDEIEKRLVNAHPLFFQHALEDIAYLLSLVDDLAKIIKGIEWRAEKLWDNSFCNCDETADYVCNLCWIANQSYEALKRMEE